MIVGVKSPVKIAAAPRLSQQLSIAGIAEAAANLLTPDRDG